MVRRGTACTRLVAPAALTACGAVVLMWGQPAWVGPAVPIDLAAWPAWAAEHGSLPAAMAVVRVATLAVGLQLVLALVVATAARLATGVAPVALVRALAPPLSRRLVEVIAGVGALAVAVPPVGASAAGSGVVAAVAAPAAGSAAGDVEWIVRDAAPDVERITWDAVADVEWITQEAVADVEWITQEAAPDVEVIARDAAADVEVIVREAAVAPDGSAPVASTVPVAPGGGHDDADADLWEVRPGDHFWSIAEQVLAAAWGRPATDAEVHRYWVALVERNADRLASPGDPDLVFAGQLMALPPVPPSPAAPAAA